MSITSDSHTQIEGPTETVSVLQPSVSSPSVRVWNVRLMVFSLVVVVVVGGCLFGLYSWQSGRLSGGLKQRAEMAERKGQVKQQAVWLERYLRLEPNDVEAFVKLGVASDESVKSASDWEQARARLTGAISKTGADSQWQEQRLDLRKRLIRRLLQGGSFWATEVKRQVVQLDAPPGDSQSLKWLAQAALALDADSQGEQVEESEPGTQQGYWARIASQPAETILLEALAADPDDFDLAIACLGIASEKPADTEADSDWSKLAELANDIVDRLTNLKQDGRAQLAAYLFLRQKTGEDETARRLLNEAVEGALERLVLHEEEEKEIGKSDGLGGQSTGLNSDRGAAGLDLSVYEPSWDWQLGLLAAATAVEEQGDAQAASIYEELLLLSKTDVGPQQREQLYLSAGQFFWDRDKRPRAVEIWGAGAETLEDSVALSSSLAKGELAIGELSKAEDLLKDLNSRIQRQASVLAGPSGRRMNNATKSSIRQELDQASWSAKVLTGQILLRREEFNAALGPLIDAFESSLTVEPQERLTCGLLLAGCYREQQLWDLTAQTLDRCISLQPDNSSLRRAAASAWRKLGALGRATERLDLMDDGSWEAAFEIAQIQASAEASQPTELRDLSDCQESLALARERYSALPAEQRQTSSDWSLSLMETFYGSEYSGDKRLARVEAISDMYPDVAEVQAAAIGSLAAAGSMDAALQALERLEAIAEPHNNPQNAATFVVAQATMAMAQEKLDEALDLIREGMELLPSEARDLALKGADMAMRGRQTRVAFEFLNGLPEESHDIGSLMALARIAVAVDRDPTSELKITPADFAGWEKKLKQLEGGVGGSGTHWRFVAIEGLLNESRRTSNGVSLLDRAQSLYQEIAKLRPRWGPAIALGRRIAAAKGDHARAIELLGRGIRDGDDQLSNVLLLVSELYALNRIDEAAKELARVTEFSDTVQQVSLWEIELAQKTGNASRALDLARAQAIRNPKELNSWLLLYETAMVLANSSKPELAQELRDEAWSALEKSLELTAGQDLRVWDARFGFQLAAGNRVQAEQELISMLAAGLPAEASSMAASRGYFRLSDYSSAERYAKTAQQLVPASYEPHAELAKIFERTGDRQAMVEELQAAYKLNPENSAIRESLALALLSGLDEVPWDEIENLLTKSVNPSPRMELMLSALYLQSGDERQKSKGLAELRLKAASVATDEASIAQRLLARYFGDLWVRMPPDEQGVRDVNNSSFSEAKRYYRELLRVAQPATLDIAGYAMLLMTAGQLDESERIVNRLSPTGDGPLIALQLKVQIAVRRGQDVQQLTSDWIESFKKEGAFTEEQLWSMAGQTLGQLGFPKQALHFIEKAYTRSPGNI